ncbi:MAG: acyltransferase family protein [Sediminibacterium sp.]
MIIVNTPGDHLTTYAPLLHAKWHGFTPTDLVFPSFLFAVGNAMSFVMGKWAQKSQAEVLAKIFKRTLLIFLLGYLMYWFPFVKMDETHHLVLSPIAETRIMGVLQRIALCYGIASLLVYYGKARIAVIISIGLLLLYWGICCWFGDPADPLSLEGNAGLKLDKWLLGDKHLYHGEGVAFDPEGLLSTLPAIGNVVAGYVVGLYVQQKGKTYEGLTRLLLAGFGLLLIAYCWNFVFPINKKLWTSSFVLHTVALDCMLLAAIIYIVDFLKKVKWTYFFEAFGKNPLFVYLLSELLVTLLNIIKIEPGVSLFRWLYLHIFSYAGAYTGSLLFALCYMLLCWSAGYWLDRRRIYIRV